jgi:hypothetical protein
MQHDQGRVTGVVQRQLTEPPTKLVTSEVEEVSAATDTEATLDKRIAARQAQDAPDGKGKYLGTVTYRNLPVKPPPAAGSPPPTNLEARAVKQALLETIITNITEKNGIEMRLRVPLEDSPVVSEYVMVVLRFDRQRNVEVEYAGKDTQARGSLTEVSVLLPELEKTYGVTFVTDGITATMPGNSKPTVFTGKAWSADDAVLLRDALPLVGGATMATLRGTKIRRLNAQRAGNAAGFYTTADGSINLADAALPFDKSIWFGEGGRFYTRGVHTVLHEIGHALHYGKVSPGNNAAPVERMALFKKAVLAESKLRTAKTASASTFPPPGIVMPTDYAATSWAEFFADAYSIYLTNPSFLNTPEFLYLHTFFKQQFP